jgi:MerR family copper efflux transcriptional regulator
MSRSLSSSWLARTVELPARWKVNPYADPVRIGQLADRTGLSTKTIRFYETAGVLPEPERQRSGYRDYDEAAVDRLAFVRAAQAAGLTLAQIRDVIGVRDSSGSPCAHVTDLLDAHAAELDRRIVELTALREQVQRLRERASTVDPAGCHPASVCQIIAGPVPQASPVDRCRTASSAPVLDVRKGMA